MTVVAQTRLVSYHQHAEANPRAVTVTRPEQLEEMVRRITAAPVTADDTETSGIRWYRGAHIVGYAAACYHEAGGVQAYYLPFRHLTGEYQIDPDRALEAIRDRFVKARADQTRVWWNRKFDEHMIRRERIAGLALTDYRDVDAMIAARLYDENTPAPLKHRALVDLGDKTAGVNEEILTRETLRLAKLAGVSKTEYIGRFGYAQIPIFMAGAYACDDVRFTLNLYRFYCERNVISYYSQSPRGPQYPGIWWTENLLSRVLCDVEEWGMPVSRERVAWLKEQTSGEVERLEREVWDVLGAHNRFNLDSDAELRDFLRHKLHIELHKTTRGGALSVDAEVLEEFAGEFPVLRLILKRREAGKLATTYTDSLLEYADEHGIIHGDFIQQGTDTGRASMQKPNLQNQPSDSDERALAATGKKVEAGGKDPWSVRRCFPVREVNGERWIRVLIDWSQIELREIADATQDANMVAAYRNGQDLHDQTTRLIYGDLPKDEMKAKRKLSKMANFGDAFGITAIGLARRAGISVPEAEDFMAKRSAAFPGIERFRRELYATAVRNGGWFSNKFGRTRRIPELLSHDDRVLSRAKRQMIASRIQGGAAELAKDSFVRLDAFLRANKLRSRLSGWIHDEIAIDVPREEFAYVAHHAKQIMEHFPDYIVPIVAEVSWTDTDWSEKRGIK